MEKTDFVETTTNRLYNKRGRTGILLVNLTVKEQKISMTKIIWALVFGLFFFSIEISAQNTEAALNALASKHPTEKLYIHYDN